MSGMQNGEVLTGIFSVIYFAAKQKYNLCKQECIK